MVDTYTRMPDLVAAAARAGVARHAPQAVTSGVGDILPPDASAAGAGWWRGTRRPHDRVSAPR
ncbi:hypothetical protein AB0A95_13555 [Micromonospora sp. NPDC049230]|uniref:hypothetical protein n=1 Tax=Micromonospora sp. NPDC049230 TaxID=3155502 RepID=UPI0033C5C27E